MNSLLLEHFDKLISTPEDVEKLNNAILQLAVQGKLLPQDSKDEPAIFLLKRVNEKYEPDDERENGTLPNGWSKCVFSDLAYVLRGVSYDKNQAQKTPDDGLLPILRANNIGSDGLNFHDLVYVPIHFVKPEQKLQKKDIVVCMSSGSANLVGKAAMLNEPFDGSFGAFCAVLRSKSNEVTQYLNLYLQSPQCRQLFSETGRGIGINNLRVSDLLNTPIELPPLAEQGRIIARVEELFAQTRLLAEQLSHSRTELDRLNESAFAHLLAAETPEEFNKCWGFIGEYFDLLTTAPEHIPPLRQSILELAVRGKLTRREAGDEPAKEILIRIKEEKGDKEKPLPAIKNSDKPFDLPEGWEWARFPEIGELARGKSKHRPRNAPFLFEDGKYPFVQTGDVAQSNGHIRKYSAMYSEQGLAQSRIWKKGTLCITIAANIAETGILEFDACFPDSVVGFVPSPIIGDAEYFQYFIKVAKSRLESYAPATAQKNINLGILQDLLIPLPSLNELKRIVKRVEQLLGWCDALESQLRSAKEERGRLVESVLARVGSL